MSVIITAKQNELILIEGKPLPPLPPDSVHHQMQRRSRSTEHLETAQQIVEELLATDPQCRENDLWLCLQVWQKFQQVKLFVPYDKLSSMYAPETLSRCRRKIQAEGKYLPQKRIIEMRQARERSVKEWSRGGQYAK